jgi:hypothetical protein
VHNRFAQVPLDQDVDTAVERRREEHALPVAGRLVHQPLHRWQESEIRHVIGLVEHGDLDARQVGVAGPHQVLESAGAGDDDVDALAQLLNLRLRGDAAEDGDRAQIRRGSQRREGRVDLGHEFTCGGKDERPRAAGDPFGRAGCESRHHRQKERVSLAGSGPAAAQNVASAKRIGQRRRLDGEGILDAVGTENVDDDLGQPEVGERGHGWPTEGLNRQSEVLRKLEWSSCPARVVPRRSV